MDKLLFPISEDTCEAGSERLTIKATSHAVKVGDIINFITGSNAGRRTIARTVPDANTFTILDIFNTSFAVGDRFLIERPAMPKRTFANVAASQTDANLVAAVAGKILRVVGMIVSRGSSASAVTFNSKPAGAGVAISATRQAGLGLDTVADINCGGWFDTASGEGLTVTTGAGSTTGIDLMYVEL